MTCNNCKGRNLKFMVSIDVEFDIEYLYKISKKAFSKKGTKIWGANWERYNIICEDCGNNIRGLQERQKYLEEEIK